MEQDVGLFISYNREATEFVDKFADLCDLYQLVYWLDRRRLVVGEDWPHKIDYAIETCRAVVLVVSPNVFASDAVKHELTLAQRYHKPIIFVYTMSFLTRLPKAYKRIALFSIAGSVVLDESDYAFLGLLRKHDLLLMTGTDFLPYFVMSEAVSGRGDPTWQIFNERLHNRFTRALILSTPYFAAGSALVLFITKGQFVPQQIALIPGLVYDSNQLNWLNYLLTFFFAGILVLSLIPIVLFILSFLLAEDGASLGQITYTRMHEAQVLPDIVVLTPKGLVLRQKSRLESQSGSDAFRYDHMDFRSVQKMEVASSMLRGLELVCSMTNRGTKRIAIPTSTGITQEKLQRFIDTSFNGEVGETQDARSQVMPVQHMMPDIAARKEVPPTPTHDAITIFYASKTLPIAQMIQKHLAGRSGATLVNVDHDNPETATFLSRSFILVLPHTDVYTSLVDTLLAWVRQEHLLLIPIRVEPSMVPIFQSMQWVDFSLPALYQLGLTHIDYALYSNGILPRPGGTIFDPTYQLAEAIYGKPDFQVYKVARKRYISNPWIFAMGRQRVEARTQLRQNQSLPELVAISPVGVVFSWRNIWRDPLHHRLEYMAATDIESMRIFDGVFWLFITFQVSGSRRRKHIILPLDRFDDAPIKANLLAERQRAL